MNKFSIATINLKKLDEEVDKFEVINNKNAYLLMNEKTADAITYEIDVNNSPLRRLSHIGFIGKYKGNKVFIDNELEFGEIELR